MKQVLTFLVICLFLIGSMPIVHAGSSSAGSKKGSQEDPNPCVEQPSKGKKGGLMSILVGSAKAFGLIGGQEGQAASSQGGLFRNLNISPVTGGYIMIGIGILSFLSASKGGKGAETGPDSEACKKYKEAQEKLNTPKNIEVSKLSEEPVNPAFPSRLFSDSISCAEMYSGEFDVNGNPRDGTAVVEVRDGDQAIIHWGAQPPVEFREGLNVHYLDKDETPECTDGCFVCADEDCMSCAITCTFDASLYTVQGEEYKGSDAVFRIKASYTAHETDPVFSADFCEQLSVS